MSVTRIVIIGAAGRMGCALARCASDQPDLRCVGAIESVGHPAVGKDVGEVAGIAKTGVLLTSDLRNVLPDADVALDFTLHSAVPGNVKLAMESGKAAVIGTTGLDAGESAVLRDAARIIPMVWVPNMSLGVNLLFALVKRAASVLGNGYRVEIDEVHHIHKTDAPSGTALRLGEKVAEGRCQDFKTVMVHNPQPTVKNQSEDKIVMRSRREGEVVGDHIVTFENQGEKIVFAHYARSRDAFALGALRAAQWVIKQPPGLYDMQDVLGLGPVK